METMVAHVLQGGEAVCENILSCRRTGKLRRESSRMPNWRWSATSSTCPTAWTTDPATDRTGIGCEPTPRCSTAAHLTKSRVASRSARPQGCRPHTRQCQARCEQIEHATRGGNTWRAQVRVTRKASRRHDGPEELDA